MLQKSLRAPLVALLATAPVVALAQTGIGIGTTAPDVSAALDIVSSSKGALLPRVALATTLATPATGLLVFQTGAPAGFYYNAGTPGAPNWQQIATAAGATVTASNGLTKTGNNIALGGPLTQATTIANAGFNFTVTGSGNVGLGNAAPAQKLDVTGNAVVSGNVGIGNTAPGAKLHVSGNLRADLTNGSFYLNNFGPSSAETVLLGTFTGSNNNAPQLRFEGVGTTRMDIGQDSAGAFVVEGNDAVRLTVQRLGNVGIGTSTPTERLQVVGNTIVSGNVGVGNTAPTQKLDVTGNAVVSGRIGVGNTSPVQALDVTGNAVVSGNVGIGNTAPGAKLHVSGNLRADLTNGSFTLNNFGPNAAETVLLGTFSGTNNNAAQLRFGNVGSTYMDIGQDSSGAFVVEGNDARRLTVERLGNVGIGTSTPAARLDVQGGADNNGNNDPGGVALSYRTGGLRHFMRSRHNTTLTGGNAVDFYLNNSTTAAGSSAPGTGNVQVLTLVNTSGLPRVGIGTTAPAATLEVSGAASTVRLGGLAGTGNRLVTVDASGNLSSSANLPTGVTGDNLGNHAATQNIGLNNFDLRMKAANNTDHGLGWYGTGKLWDGLNTNGPVLYGTSGGVLGTVVSGVQQSVLTWKTGGNVGIGTNAPTQKLDVTGNAVVSGNVGIGTTTPTQALDVRGNLRLGNDDNATGVGSAIEFVGPGVNTDVMGLYRANVVDNASELRVVLGDDPGGSSAEKFVLGTTDVYGSPDLLLSGTFTPRFTVVSDGSTGIGDAAANPTATLDVAGSARVRNLTTAGIVTTDASGNLSSVTAASLDATTASNGLTRTGSDVALGGTLTQATTLATGGFNLNVTGTGNVGIGTSTPLSRLSISPSAVEAKLTLYDGGSTTNHYGFGISGNQLNYHVLGASDRHVFYAGGKNGDGTELLRIQGNGNVGIGTSAPAAGLHVDRPESGSNSTLGVLLSGGTSGNPSIELRGSGKIPYIDFAETSGVDYTTRLISQGGVLNVSGAGSGGLLLKVNGNLQVNATTYTSDQRFKQNVRPLAGALASVRALRGVRYEWNALGVQRGGTAGAGQVGLLAQELEKVYPELVFTDAQGYKSVNYAQLTPVLIEALKELAARNAVLEAKAASTEAAAAADHASLLTLQAQMARLLGEGTRASAARPK